MMRASSVGVCVRLGLRLCLATLTATAALGAFAPLRAQDTLRLDVLERMADSADPRARQIALQRAASALRMRTLTSHDLPRLALQGHAIRQSEVTTLPIDLPGMGHPGPHPDNYEAALTLDQVIYDPASAPRRAAERAQLAEDLARVHASLYALREQVEASYFTAALLQLQSAELTATGRDLGARLSMMRARVRNGSALPGDADAIEAEQLTLEQRRDAIDADREAELRVLSALTGRPIAATDVLTVPATAPAAAALDTSRSAVALQARPELERFARTRERLLRTAGVAAAATRPTVAAFGRAAYGRPGLDMLRLDFHDYWQVGVRVEWRPWDWGSARRDASVLDLQARMVSTDSAAFVRDLGDALARVTARIEAARRAIGTDTVIVALRERIEREARHRLDEGVITSSEYVDRRDDLLRARLAADAHRVQLAQAIAAYRTTLGAPPISSDSGARE